MEVLCDVKKKHSAHAVTGAPPAPGEALPPPPPLSQPTAPQAADVSLADTVRAATFFNADGVIVTGSATGAPPRALPVPRLAASEPAATPACAGDAADPADVRRAIRAAAGSPVLVGSGVTKDNVAAYADARALIVGSSIKTGGQWWHSLDEAKANAFVEAVRALGEGCE